MSRRFQFSLKTLLVLVTAACITFWVAMLRCDDLYQWLILSFVAINVFAILYR